MTKTELPPLPEPAEYVNRVSHEGADYDEAAFLAEQMHAYARTALAPLEAELERMRAALTQKVTDETMISELGLHGGNLNASFEGGACRLLAEAFADQFDKAGATNYVEVTLTDPQDHARAFVVTLQRKAGKTPHALRMEAEAELERMRMDAARLREALEGLLRFAGCSGGDDSHLEVQQARAAIGESA
jgi:hypothetical protein